MAGLPRCREGKPTGGLSSVARLGDAGQEAERLLLVMIIAGVIVLVGTPLAMTYRVLADAASASASPPPQYVVIPAPPPPAAQPSPPSAAEAMAPPTRLDIEAIDVSAPIVQVGLDAGGVIEPPPLDEENLVGWYGLGPSPGEVGPAVLLGHVDTRTAPAVFARLKELRPQDRITVAHTDGRRQGRSVLML